MKRKLALGLALVAALIVPALVRGDVGIGPGGGTPGTSSNFTLVGHNALSGFELDGNTVPRGMNAALAVYTDPASGKRYVYIGNRTDGSSACGVGDPRGPGNNCPHPHPGILVVDATDPSAPTVVGEFGQEFATGAFLGQTSRELRVWPQQKLLMVMYFRCSSVIHACPSGTPNTWRIRFFDLSDPVHPTLVSTYVPSAKPHEMYLWVDPSNADRALLWISTPTLSTNPAVPNLIITDISQAREGVFTEIAKGNWNNRYPGTTGPQYPADYNFNLFVHSMAPTANGKTTYLAMEAGQFLVLDTSAVVADTDDHFVNLNDKLLTDPRNRPTWLQSPPDPAATPNPCAKNCPNGHSAVPVPGRPFALTTDEVYGTFTDPSFGCRWGWARLINVANPARPKIVGEYQIAEDTPAFCGSAFDDAVTEQFRSYSSHNPTLTRDLAFIDWHSGGLQAIDISDPGTPTQAGWFTPTPEPTVANEDPALSQGTDSRGNKVVFWSYPIIDGGLIYCVDIRNGLYILKYTGPNASEVDSVSFLEGNSNLGDAVALSKSGG